MIKLLIHIIEHIKNGDYELAINILQKLIETCKKEKGIYGK